MNRGIFFHGAFSIAVTLAAAPGILIGAEKKKPPSSAGPVRLPVKQFRATASRTAEVHDPSHAFDGNTKTRWATGDTMQPGDWYALDLGRVVYVDRLILTCPRHTHDYPAAYEVRLSPDGKLWSKPAVTGKGRRKQTVITIPEPLPARHVKITQTGKPSGDYWWGIAELQVYGRAGPSMKQRLQDTAGNEPDPAEGYRALFGDREKAVSATPEKQDDAALAAELLRTIDTIPRRPRLQLLLYDKIYDLGKTAAPARDTAVTAMRKLMADAPERGGDCSEKLVHLHELQYAAAAGPARNKAAAALAAALEAAGDALAGAGKAGAAVKRYGKALALDEKGEAGGRNRLSKKIDFARNLAAVEDDLESLRKQVKETPGDTDVRNALIRLTITALDNPAAAQKLLTDETNPALRKNVPLAAVPAAEITGGRCLQLGRWYHGLAREEKLPFFKKRLLRRARGWFWRFKKNRTARDVKQLKADLSLAEIEAALNAMVAADLKAGGWIDLAPLLSVGRHAVAGTWRVHGGTVECAHKSASRERSIKMPARPTGNYRFAVSFRMPADGIASISLPVPPDRRVAWACSGNGTTGIGPIDGVQWHEKKNRTRRIVSPFKPGGIHEVEAQVFSRAGTAGVEIAIDGRRVIRWRGRLSAVPKGGKTIQPGFYRTGGTFLDPRIMATTGTIVPVR